MSFNQSTTRTVLVTLALVATQIMLAPTLSAAAHPTEGAAADLTADNLPVGVQGAGSAIVLLLRLLLGAWGLVLLIIGGERPRWSVATVAAALCLALGLGSMWSYSYFLGLVLAWALLAAAMALDTWFPRLGLAAASWWPFAAAYVMHIHLKGLLMPSSWLTLLLVAVGIALAATLPRLGAAVLGASSGVCLVLIAVQPKLSAPLVFGLAAAGLLWQALILPRLGLGRQPGPTRRPADAIVAAPGAAPELYCTESGADSPTTEVRPPARSLVWRRRALLGLAVLLGGALLIVLLSPHYSPGSIADSRRLEALLAEPEAAQRSLVLTPESNLYLGGEPHPIALVSRSGSFADRLLLLATGASSGASVRRLRSVKEDAELEHLRRAAAITSGTFSVIEPMIFPGVSEAEIDRAVRESFIRQGASGLAFSSVVGSGANAVLPHYQRNSQIMESGLVVIDIGCMVNSYASDMTRSFVIRPEPTAAELAVLRTTAAAVKASRQALGPGVSLRDVEQAARDVLEQAGLEQFFTHSIGHHVGLDVHDPHQNELEPGMVITVEPGVYIPEGASIDPSYWSLGARLEDTYLVTDSGWEMLTDYPLLPSHIQRMIEEEPHRDDDAGESGGGSADLLGAGEVLQ